MSTQKAQDLVLLRYLEEALADSEDAPVARRANLMATAAAAPAPTRAGGLSLAALASLAIALLPPGELRSDMTAALADGELTIAEIIGIVVKFVRARLGGGDRPDAPDAPGVPSTPANPAPPEPPAPGAVLWPDELEAELVSITHGPSGDEIPYVVKPSGAIVTGTDRIHHRSLLYVRCGAKRNGVGFRLDPGTPQGGCLRFRAFGESGNVLAELGGDHFPINGDDGKPTTAHRIDQGVGTREDRYRKESGTACVYNLNTGGLGPVRLDVVALDGNGQIVATSNAFRTPPVDDAN